MTFVVDFSSARKIKKKKEERGGRKRERERGSAIDELVDENVDGNRLTAGRKRCVRIVFY